MGSTGSGSFSDYSRRKPTNPNTKNGGASGKDNCDQAFSAPLEEVARCFYYMNNGDVPPVNTEVSLSFNGVRLVIETGLGEEVGYLPTKFNYLKSCLDSGINYSGTVTSSSTKPSPMVRVDMVPI